MDGWIMDMLAGRPATKRILLLVWPAAVGVCGVAGKNEWGTCHCQWSLGSVQLPLKPAWTPLHGQGVWFVWFI
jgi:hypothetical protein